MINLFLFSLFYPHINVNPIAGQKFLLWNSIFRSSTFDLASALLELQQEFDISKVASETVENVKEKVSGLIPDKVKEMLPELEKKSSEERPESGKSETSESEATADKSSDKSASEKKDENNNPDAKKPPQPEEEEVN